jgi:hypothetical protein
MGSVAEKASLDLASAVKKTFGLEKEGKRAIFQI